jgi:hypothetical protein
MQMQMQKKRISIPFLGFLIANVIGVFRRGTPETSKNNNMAYKQHQR